MEDEIVINFAYRTFKWTDELDYIMGNPPFVGARYMDKDQSRDLKNVLGNIKGFGKLDYVVGWYKKASELMNKANIKSTFVSTNSITQGEQVAPFWENIFATNNLKILFAYQTFVWASEAKDRAAVNCVIIGFGKDNYNKKQLYLSDTQLKLVDNISPYLLDAPSFVAKSRTKPICNVKEAKTGTRVGAQQYVFTQKQMNDFIESEPLSKKYFHEYLGGEEFLNNKKRFCLYLEDCSIEELNKMPKSKKIIEKVLSERQLKDHRLKDFPRKYVKLSIPKYDYIFIPQVSSERRKYIPIGIISKDVWVADPHFMVEGGDLYYFGILISNVHMSWMRVFAGRLKSDYRYSKNLVFNTFPWPSPTEPQKEKIEKTAQKILDIRDFYSDSSLSDLYDELLMPSELRKAHQDNDKAVMEAYGFDWRTMTESECVAELMKLYQKLVD